MFVTFLNRPYGFKKKINAKIMQVAEKNLIDKIQLV